MNYIEIIGYIGGFFSSISFAPQVWKIIKTKSAKDISMGTLALLLLNISCWLTYGILARLMPVWITNGIVMAMVLIMLFLKLKYDKNG